jgi:hypothetical protein
LASRSVAKPPTTALAAEDINHDGQVDILDAFALARQIEAGSPTAANLDLNRDGVVNRRDVELVAARAVRLQALAPHPGPEVR